MSSHIIEGNQSVNHSIEAYTTPSKPADENPVQQVAQGVFLREQSCASSSSEQFVFSKDGLPNEAIYRILSLFIESLPPKEAAREIAQKTFLFGEWERMYRTLLIDCINNKKLSFQDVGVNTIEKLKCFLIAHGEGLRNLSLEFLCINASEVKDVIALCPNLESLSMRILEATDSTLKDIATLKKLTHLHLEFDGKLEISGLQDIATLENLTHLEIDCPFSRHFTDDDAKEIAKLKKLTYLSLQTDKAFTNDAIKELSTLTELTYLNITNSENVTDEAMKDLVKLSKLEHLSLYGCRKLTDIGIELVATLENLTHLDLSWIKLTDRTLENVAKLQKLTHLKFLMFLGDHEDPDYLPFTDNGMKYIGQLTNLTHLGLRGAKLITDEAAKEISKLRKLKYLDLSQCLELGDGAAAEIATLTDLTDLLLSHNDKLTHNGIAEFVKLPSLKYLNVEYCGGVDDTSARFIGMLESLKHLDLSYCEGLTSAAIEEITKLKNLRVLSWDRTPSFEGFDDATIELIASNLTDIKVLFLEGWRPSDDMARRLVKLPKLQFLDLRHTLTLSNAVEEEIKASFKGAVLFSG